MVRIALKNKEIHAPRSFFLTSPSPNHPDIKWMKGTITAIPYKDQRHTYSISWNHQIYDGKFDLSELRTQVDNNDKTNVAHLKDARKKYIELNPPITIQNATTTTTNNTVAQNISTTSSESNTPITNNSTPSRMNERRRFQVANLISDQNQIPINSTERRSQRYDMAQGLGDYSQDSIDIAPLQLGAELEEEDSSLEGRDCDIDENIDELTLLELDDNAEFLDMEAEDYTDDQDEEEEAPLNSSGRNLTFKFEDVDEGVGIPVQDCASNMAAEEPKLKRIPKGTFDSVLNCFFFVSNLDRDFFKKMAFNMNSYANENKSETNEFGGTKWKPHFFSVKIILHFLGIMLKISLDGRRQGGYEQYFKDCNYIKATSRKRYKITGHTAWAKKIMPLRHFKQVRAAFRVEKKGDKRVGDKAYQLRRVATRISEGARRTFVPGRNMSFDEGGIASRSRRNPIRQYCKDKPNKFRVDFFILADAKEYFIYNLEPYQGRNGGNIGMTNSPQ